MTDQLTADVERWLAEEVRTTWPGKSGDCCDTHERAELAEWFAGQIRAFGLWIAKTQPTYTFLIAGSAAVCPGEPRTGRDSTQTAEKPNQSTGRTVVIDRTDYSDHDRQSGPQDDVVLTLLEAAQNAKGDDAIDRAHQESQRLRGEGPRSGDRWLTRCGRAALVASNDWEPPAPGTHESDLYMQMKIDHQAERIATDEWVRARDWSRENAR